MSRIIKWEKFVDPLGGNIDDFDYESVDDFDDLTDEEREEMAELEAGLVEEEEQIVSSPAIVTPRGIIPIMPFNNPAKAFNFWMGHTNFDIDEEAALVLNKIPGVEILDVFTRYCFRIAVGKCFESIDVRLAIEAALMTDRSRKLEIKIENIIESQLSKYKHWALFVAPNGNIETTYANNKNKKFKEAIQSYQQKSKELNGGILLQSEDKGV